jgi:O-antigen biosynthesis protein WbqP
MSIVGPRPALWNQEDLIEERQRLGANDLRPGLTGLAQVKGRDELPISVKAAYDGEYCGKLSFLLDCRIVWQTVKAVLSGSGVAEGAKETKDNQK